MFWHWLIISSLLISLSTAGQPTYTIKADIKGLVSRTVTVSYWRQLNYQTDTIPVQQDRFELTMMPTDGNVATLQVSPTEQITFWLEKPLVRITGSTGPTTLLYCIGTAENDLMESYRQTIERPFAIRKRGKSSAQADPIVLEEYRRTRQFIEHHPNSLTAAYLLYWQTMYDTTIFDTLDKLLAKLAPAIRNSYWAQRASSRMYNVRHKPRIGQPLPSFNIATATGGILTLDSLKGKYVLLDFWGTWCIPCVAGIPELKALEAKYRDQLTVVSIALERPTDRAKWLRLIDKYGMSWPQGIEMGSRQEGVNGLYNVWEYPTMMLADPRGVYIAKIKYGQPLDESVQVFIQK